jgi:hypothetical protein
MFGVMAIVVSSLAWSCGAGAPAPMSGFAAQFERLQVADDGRWQWAAEFEVASVPGNWCCAPISMSRS